MTMTESKALREIHEIREQIASRTKGMSHNEYNALVEKEVYELCQKYNFHPHWVNLKNQAFLK